MLAVVMVAALYARFGFDSSKTTHGPFSVSYSALGVTLALVWMATLQVFGSRDARIVGDGPLEYQRVALSTMMVFGCLAIVSVIFKMDMSRGYLAIAFPGGLVALLLVRKGNRIWLRRRRARGDALTSVLIIGGPGSALEIANCFARTPAAGMRAAGLWVPVGDIELEQVPWATERGLAVFGPTATLTEALAESSATMVIVTDSEHVGHRGLKELAWTLAASDVDLMVSPNVVDVTNGRLQLTAVASMPFLHIDEPQYEAAAAWPKLIFDKVGAAVLLVAVAPILLATALAIKLGSRGPVFYMQERVGRDGVPFRMIKFRSMNVGADAELRSLLAATGQADQPLGKLQEDPRVTRVGRFIRRYSIDELPQLFNVVKGDMSLVGPRPQRDFEVEMYDDVAHRRLRVRPGMTGLWQVSGRSDLSWDDAIGLDTHYVENWSMTSDVVILLKTLRAVIGTDGAY